MIVEIYSAPSHGTSTSQSAQGEKEALEEAERSMGLGRVRDVAEEEKEGQSDGEESDELGVRRGHSIALPMHF